MYFLDSNIIIYSVQPEHQYLRDYLRENELIISKITLLEVLGYYKLTQQEKEDFSRLLENMKHVSISDEIISKAIQLRQSRKLSIGDSLIAASAITSQAILLTANVLDFEWIIELTTYNPIHK